MIAPYEKWLIVFNVLPLALLWTLFYRELVPYIKTFISCIIASEIVGLLWDYFAIHFHIWYWPTACCTLPRIIGLPLEETIFMAFTAALIVAVTIITRDAFSTHRRYKRKLR